MNPVCFLSYEELVHTGLEFSNGKKYWGGFEIQEINLSKFSKEEVAYYRKQAFKMLESAKYRVTTVWGWTTETTDIFKYGEFYKESSKPVKTSKKVLEATPAYWPVLPGEVVHFRMGIPAEVDKFLKSLGLEYSEWKAKYTPYPPEWVFETQEDTEDNEDNEVSPETIEDVFNQLKGIFGKK